jgi:Mn2+/Fe2+ NRAMP family transporter
VAVLTVSTFAATAIALTQVQWATVPLLPELDTFSAARMLGVAALIGWMPSAIDVSVWQSLWTLARRRDTGHAPAVRESLLDFHIGYWGTALLALCFVTLGASVMYGRGVPFAPSAGGFAAQVIALYTQTLGDWARPVIGAAALSVMFSTTLTVVDGFPRALTVLVARFRGPEQPGAADADRDANRVVYWAAIAVLGIASVAILSAYLNKLQQLVDLATVLSFLTAPILSWLNHRAIQSSEVPVESRPRPWLVNASWVGIGLQGAFALYFLYLRYLR